MRLKTRGTYISLLTRKVDANNQEVYDKNSRGLLFPIRFAQNQGGH